MGFGAITQPAATAGDGITDGATIDAALTTARASGADGDVFRVTSNGALYTFWKPADTPGWLIPSDVYDGITIVSNGADKCYITLSDTFTGGAVPSGTLIDRGWTAHEGSLSTVEDKTDGSAWQITNSGSGGYSAGYVQWAGSGSSFGAATDYFIAAKIECDVSSLIQYQYMELSDGSRRRRFSVGDGSGNEGHFWWFNNTTKKGVSTITTDDTTARWVFFRVGGNVSNLMTASLEDPQNTCTAYNTDMGTTSGNRIIAMHYATSGSSPWGEGKVYELVMGALA